MISRGDMKIQPTSHSAWQLIKNGEFADAVNEYEEIFSIEKDLTNLRNLAYARLLNGNVDEALKDFQEVIIMTDPKYFNQSDFMNLGICYFIQGENASAVKEWKNALKVPYVDVAGGVFPLGILFYAGYRLGDQVLIQFGQKQLNRFYSKRMRQIGQLEKSIKTDINQPAVHGWPASLVELLLEKTDTVGIEQAIKVKGGGLLARNLCTFYFHVGAKHLRDQDFVSFFECMKKCSEQKAFIEPVSIIARWELSTIVNK